MTTQTKELVEYLLEEIKVCAKQVEEAIAAFNHKKLEKITLVNQACSSIDKTHAEIVRVGSENIIKEFLLLRGKIILFMVKAIDELKEIYLVGQQVVDVTPQRRTLNEIFVDLLNIEKELKQFISQHQDVFDPEPSIAVEPPSPPEPSPKKRKKEIEVEDPLPDKEDPVNV